MAYTQIRHCLSILISVIPKPDAKDIDFDIKVLQEFFYIFFRNHGANLQQYNNKNNYKVVCLRQNKLFYNNQKTYGAAAPKNDAGQYVDTGSSARQLFNRIRSSFFSPDVIA